MNFYRKKNRIVASFGEKELSGEPDEVLKSLNSLLPVDQGKELRISIAENTDLNMDVLSVLAAFSVLRMQEGTPVELRAQKEINERLNTLNIHHCFTSVTSGE